MAEPQQLDDRDHDDDITLPFVRTRRPQASHVQDDPCTRNDPRAAAPAPPRTDRDCLWDTNAVATFLQVSRSWVYQKAEAGLIPVIRLPGSSLLRFESEAIRAFSRGEWLPGKIPVVRVVKARK